jgi:acyl-CoA oxidase
MIQFVNNESPKDFTLRLQLLILVDPGFLTRLAVHYGLFLNTIMGQGMPEQVSYWVGRGAGDFKGIIGCYAMTELG